MPLLVTSPKSFLERKLFLKRLGMNWTLPADSRELTMKVCILARKTSKNIVTEDIKL